MCWRPCALNRIERLAETLRAALNAVAVAAPDWLHALTQPEWHERCGRRIEDRRLSETGPKRDAYVVQVGTDGYQRLDGLAGKNAPAGVAALPAVAVLRRVWARHFERYEEERGGGAPPGVRLQRVKGRGPGDRIESPCDVDARHRSKSNRSWTGHMAHLTEACDAGAPHLVLHADTTPANVHEAMRVEAIHTALAAKGLAPSEHLVDSADISADHLIRAREQHGIDRVGPGQTRTGWQARTEGAFDTTDFTIDWEGEVARCPEGRTSTSWRGDHDKATGPDVRARSNAANRNPGPSKPRCTRGRDQGRQLTLPAREQHEALAAVRRRGDTEQGRRLYAQRHGTEGTISQGMRGFGLRRARCHGLAKTGLQSVATAAAINLDRLAAWLAQRPLAATQGSRFAAMPT